MLVVIAVSFFDYERWQIVPTFILDNYVELFHLERDIAAIPERDQIRGDRLGDHAVHRLHGGLFPGLPCPQPAVKIGLFLLCTVPFWTSNIIRMISWIPFLGRNGVFNSGARWRVGIIDAPLEFLLFSDFAVIVAYVHCSRCS